METADRGPDDRRIDRLRALVEAESPTGDADGVRAAMTLLEAMVRDDTGREPALLALDGGVSALLLGAVRRPAVLLLCHIDTVWPRGTLASMPFAVDGARITGPGTFDMKAGLVVALEVLRTCAARDAITLLVTADEETGSAASRALIEATAARSVAVLVLEGSGPGGALKHARKGVGIYDLAIEGRAAHAGTEPEKGVNATVELARLVLDLVALSDPGAGTSVTPTVARSGVTTNTVPAAARLGVDVRARSAREMDRVDAAIRARSAALPGATIRVHGGPNRPPLEAQRSAWLLGLAREAAAELGHGPLESVAVGGGSDGNFTAAIGIPTLDGLGAVGGNGHAPGEWVDAASLASRSRLVARLVERIVDAGAEPAS